LHKLEMSQGILDLVMAASQVKSLKDFNGFSLEMLETGPGEARMAV
jgi:hypothetical protein